MTVKLPLMVNRPMVSQAGAIRPPAFITTFPFRVPSPARIAPLASVSVFDAPTRLRVAPPNRSIRPSLINAKPVLMDAVEVPVTEISEPGLLIRRPLPSRDAGPLFRLISKIPFSVSTPGLFSKIASDRVILFIREIPSVQIKAPSFNTVKGVAALAPAKVSPVENPPNEVTVELGGILKIPSPEINPPLMLKISGIVKFCAFRIMPSFNVNVIAGLNTVGVSKFNTPVA